MIHRPTPHDSSEAAATIVLMMLRFAQASLPSSDPGHPNQVGRLGVDAYRVLPDGSHLPESEFVKWLQQLPKPAVVSPLLRRGTGGIWSADHISSRTRQVIDRNIRNQEAIVVEYAAEHQLSPAAPILVEIADEDLLVTLNDVRTWAASYGVDVGWQLRQSGSNIGGKTRMVLIRSDGMWSPGGELGHESQSPPDT